jgi:hypothetical protein
MLIVMQINWANNSDNHLFTLGYVFLLGNGSISENNKKQPYKKQPYIAMSSTKVEYMTNSQARKQGMWLSSSFEALMNY